jgi:hypothetical protein
MFKTFVLIASATAALVAATPAATVDVPAGDKIAVRLVTDVGSRTRNEGDVFAVKTVNDYAVGGALVLPKGSPGYGVITEARHAAGAHVNGELTLVIKSLTEPGGGDLLVSVPGQISDATVIKEHNGSTAGQYLFCGFVCLAAKKGDDVLLKEGSDFHVVTLANSAVATVPDGTAPATLDPKYEPTPDPGVHTFPPSATPSPSPTP